MREEWFARPVLYVAGIDNAVGFYVDRLGFTESWRHGQEAGASVAQVERQGCALILSSQWPGRVSNGLMFVSLNIDAPPDAGNAAMSVALDRLRGEFESRGVDVREGWWGYRVLMVRDPDGNELWFNYPNTDPPPAE